MPNRYRDIKNIKMKPMCFESQALGVTNKGVLIPCCYCDQNKTLNDPDFKKLTDVSNIADYDKIEDIFKNKEWKEFYDLLKNDRAPCHACYITCGVKEDGTPIKQVREDTHFNEDGTEKGKRIV
jgi:hypothetical protein|tara:strand:- start:616 stop:987 length:372 start_codon:yes stop_codon:yes gene_type:complete